MDRLYSLLDIIDQARAATATDSLSACRRRRSNEHWTYRRAESAQPDRRLAASGARLKPDDRLLVWTPSSPAVPACISVRCGPARPSCPDLRMSPGAIERIVARADAHHLILGTGRKHPTRRCSAGALPALDRRAIGGRTGPFLPGRLGNPGQRLARPQAMTSPRSSSRPALPVSRRVSSSPTPN